MVKQREAVLAGLITAVGGAVILRMIGLLVVSHIDHGLYTRLVGRTNATPNWEPWWGFWLLWGGSLAVASLLAVVVGWLWARR